MFSIDGKIPVSGTDARRLLICFADEPAAYECARIIDFENFSAQEHDDRESIRRLPIRLTNRKDMKPKVDSRFNWREGQSRSRADFRCVPLRN
jgi:hypothetical protein